MAISRRLERPGFQWKPVQEPNGYLRVVGSPAMHGALPKSPTWLIERNPAYAPSMGNEGAILGRDDRVLLDGHPGRSKEDGSQYSNFEQCFQTERKRATKSDVPGFLGAPDALPAPDGATVAAQPTFQWISFSFPCSFYPAIASPSPSTITGTL